MMLALALVGIIALTACGGGALDDESSSTTDADGTTSAAITESETDSESASVTETATDIETESDTDNETDADSTVNTESETLGATETEALSGTETETLPETESDTSAATETESETAAAPILPADAIHVTEQGITTGAGRAMENSVALATLIGTLSDGATLYFPEGTYEVAFPMFIAGKQNIRIVGENATLLRTGVVNTVSQQSPIETDALPPEYVSLTGSSAFIMAQGAHGLTIEGLTFCYDAPTSLSGKVLSVDGGSAVIEITDGSVVTGGEYATVINTFTSGGTPDRVLEQYAESQFTVEKIDEMTIRVSGLAPGGASNLRNGTRVCLRLCTGRDYIITVLSSADLTFRNLHLQSSFNGGIMLVERCGSATLDRVLVQSPNPEALMSLNADVLHIADMTGTLNVDNCTFDRPGDDCVNIHSGAYVVESVEGSIVTMTSPRFGNSPVWAIPGDTLAFYDPTTFSVVATARVTAVNGKNYTVDSPAGIMGGCIVSNTATRPSVTIRNTSVSNTRARGFLLQTDKATVENCTFRGTALAAILVASDVDTWFEMSPTRELIIRGNTIENCGYHAAGAIQITASHDNPGKVYASKIHGTIEVTDNTFAGIRTPAVYALCTESLTVTGNEMTSKGYRDAYLWVKSCGTVTVSNIEADRIESKDVDNLVTA